MRPNVSSYILCCFLVFKCLYCSGETLNDNLNDFEANYFNTKSKSTFNFTEIQVGPCNVPVENEPITQKHFLNTYAYVSPVIFKKYDNERNKLFKEKCEIDNLYTEYGHKYVNLNVCFQLTLQ